MIVRRLLLYLKGAANDNRPARMFRLVDKSELSKE